MKFKIIPLFLFIVLTFSTSCSKKNPDGPDESNKDINIKNAKVILEGRINQYDISDNFPDVLVANMYDGGLYKTVNSGKTWSKIKTFHSIIDVCIDDNNPADIYFVVPT